MLVLLKAPTFNVYAQKDPEGANLDHIQIIKGWVETDGKLLAVGNTVKVKDTTYTNKIGAATLMGSWTNSNFDATINAFYYVDVLENYTTLEYLGCCKSQFKMIDDVPVTIQERAWTSPIWYTPK